MTTKGVRSFKNLQDAHNFIANYMRKGQNQCSFEMEATGDEGSGEEKADEETVDEVFVTITKTRDWFMKQQKELVRYQTELRFLKEKFGDVFKAKAADTKRARYTK
ncbi:hypothetical protein P3T76_012031 [Phytophthora citrophthora]|uniref:Uncharacterized protein n=1 Tax=Phytophthora citrophthora TaxID=4793 RepID=A0AAD9G5Y7_9STRA|nr:hypothetical protein P3T76_012031 [Phytophthora citrophthora]